MKDIYTMELHEVVSLSIGNPDMVQIRRVPGGWIYEMSQDAGGGMFTISAVFVPWSNEFIRSNQ